MISNDDVFDAMADIQRRQLLVRLFHNEPQPVPRLSNVSKEILDANERLLEEYLSGSLEIANAEKADIRTHHIHLPKLAAYNYIDWNQVAHVTTQGPKFDDVKPLLEVVEDNQDERPIKDESAIIQK